MLIVGWIIFSLINAFILLSFDYSTHNKLGQIVFGMSGALSASLVLFATVSGTTKEFPIVFAAVLFFEIFLLFALYSAKISKWSSGKTTFS